jgi:hypothetical protein
MKTNEIIFRALPMHGKGFVYGYYRHVLIVNGLATGVNYDSHKIMEFSPNRLEHDVLEHTVSQYINKLDSFENKIFVGDVLEYTYLDGRKAKHLVMFVEGGFAINTFWDDINKKNIGFVCPITDMQTNSYLDNCKVIGNIYESPELIENKMKRRCYIHDRCAFFDVNDIKCFSEKIDCLGSKQCYR